MIQLKREQGKAIAPKLSVICIGNAGVNLADRLTVERSSAGDVVAINSDSQSLMACVAPNKIQIGQQATRGLGSGGDPDLGIEAVEESLDEIIPFLEQRDVVVVAAGFGGGTGSGAAPVVAEAAKNAGAFVVGLVTHPFQFEGRRRQAQARDAEERIARYCDLLLIFENDRLAEVAEPSSGIHDAFSAADLLLHETIESFASMFQSGGPMQIRFDDLVGFARQCEANAGIGTGIADGPNRANEAIEAALKCPLLSRGEFLDRTGEVLVHFTAPFDFSFVELQSAMNLVERHVPDDARISFGIGNSDAGGLRVTLLAGVLAAGREPVQARYVEPEAAPVEHRRATRPEPAPEPEPVEQVHEPVEEPAVEPPAAEAQSEPEWVEDEPELIPMKPEATQQEAAVEEEVPEGVKAEAEEHEEDPTPPSSERPRSPAPIRSAARQPTQPAPTKEQQQTLQFEPVARGRFEKSEPTIVEGEDLDVPTFLRLRLKK